MQIHKYMFTMNPFKPLKNIWSHDPFEEIYREYRYKHFPKFHPKTWSDLENDPQRKIINERNRKKLCELTSNQNHNLDFTSWSAWL